MGIASLALFLFAASLPRSQGSALDAQAVEAAWHRLDARAQETAIRLLRERCDGLQTKQMSILRSLLASDPREEKRLPRASPPPFYDPGVHAEALPIARKELGPEDAQLEEARKLFLPPEDGRTLRSAFHYDWGTRTIQREDELDLESVCVNAWNGVPPGLDRAWVIALRALDGGHEARSLAAFDHVYTDRAGLVYPGITLYDAWSSGATMEMPDVDALGILHEVVGDWTTWVSPVPAQEHPALYARIQELFEPARRYRELRETLADLLLIARPVRRGSLGKTFTNLHAAWTTHDSDPARLARTLPGAAGSRGFVEDWVRACVEDPALYGRARVREAGLSSDAEAVRSLLIETLAEVGAFPEEREPDPGAPRDRTESPGGGADDTPAPASNGGGEPELDRVHQAGSTNPRDPYRGPR